MLNNQPRLRLIELSVCDARAMRDVTAREQPDWIFHLAAETHVDRSIDAAGVFIQTNVIGTYAMLEGAAADRFRFVHISTDEVFGSLGADGLFTETTPYDPSSPYSASKAGSDHLVNAWNRTYGLPTLISNCSNNYGPRQFPEKLIPLMILNAAAGKALPVYGEGKNIRDWLHVEDHADALIAIAERGVLGETYNVGGKSEQTNLDVVKRICALMDTRRPKETGHSELIEFVDDRPGHDMRYAVDTAKISKTINWSPTHSFEAGLAETVDWYLANEDWWRPLLTREGAGERLGMLAAARLEAGV
ncbi:UNVERIFIED_CONTAM: hypothetical protein GTU68_022523 [Idotea baltica]|nr:hypothetical protein [Idotea baltica]